MDTNKGNCSSIIGHAMRLLPGDDLYKSIEQYAKDNNIQAGFIMTCVGSLKEVHIRLASEEDYMKQQKCFEITSLVGCISCNNRLHLHISISDNEGKVYGGHLMNEGNIVFTTAEIVIGQMPNLIFDKEYCTQSKWNELKISTVKSNTDTNTNINQK